MGDLHWFPVVTKNWWAIDFRQMKYGNQVIAQFNFYDSAIAVVDTGTSIITVPKRFFEIL